MNKARFFAASVLALSLSAAAAQSIELQLRFVSLPNATATSILLKEKDATRQLVMALETSEGADGATRGEMSVRARNGYHEQFKDIATVDTELTASPDAKWIDATIGILIDRSSVMTSCRMSAGKQILLAALPDPAVADKQTLLVFAKAGVAAEKP